MIMANDVQITDIKTVLQRYLKGFRRDYDELVSTLSTPFLQREVLFIHLQGLRDCISLMNQDFEALVDILLKIDWPVMGDEIASEYQACIINLISAHTYYLDICLTSLIKSFSAKAASPEPNDAAEQVRFVHIHNLLRSICKIVPSATTTMLQLLEKYLPFHNRNTNDHVSYIKNVLYIPSYFPPARHRILHLVIGHMIDIDVRCRREDIEECEDQQCDMFDMEVEDEFRDGPVMKHPLAEKLDMMMEVLLLYIKSTCFTDGKLNWASTRKLYRELLSVFADTILPTYSSSYVQFILFYICSLKEELSEGFIDFLWKSVQNPNAETVHRQAAAAYIAGFIARATFISISTVKLELELLGQWLHRYIEQADLTTQSDTWRHGTFYSVSQTLFYIFIFRHKELVKSKKDRKWVTSLRLHTLITSRLNPLRVCLPVIVRTFSSIARIHQIAFCDAVIERNNRSTLPVAPQNNLPLSNFNSLDSFFPFDPYILLRSGKYICDIYREYEGSITEDNTVKENEDYLDDLKADHHVSVNSPLTMDFMNYGTSPGFKHI